MRRRRSSRRHADIKPPAPVPLGPPVSRGEWITVAAIVLIAAVLRFAFPDRMAIEHFDEGVYASNIFFGAEDGNRYPYRHLYAPPLLPWLIEWCIVFLGPQGIAPFLPALVLGTATIPLAWWAARCWFGPIAGLAAGFLFATSDFHILYSRTALTDVPVAFFILLAVYLYWEAIRRNSVAWSIAAGVATGLAWWTKYTGWLPLAIAASGSLAWVLFSWRAAGVSPRVRLTTFTKCFATMAITAFVVWSPVLIGLQDYGGYAAVAENHEGYVQPLNMWHSNLRKQSSNIADQTGTMTALGIVLFGALIPAVSNCHVGLASLWQRLDVVRGGLAVWSVLMCGWVLYELGPVPLIAIWSAVGIAIALLASDQGEDESGEHVSARKLAVWLLAAWFVGMLVATPCYLPYPRLAMPWVDAALLGTTAWVSSGGSQKHLNSRTLTFAIILLIFPAMILVASRRKNPLQPPSFTLFAVPGWEDRNCIEQQCAKLAARIRAQVPDGQPTMIFSYDTVNGPASYYQLAAQFAGTETAVLPAGSLPTFEGVRPAFPTFVVSNAETRMVHEGVPPATSAFVPESWQVLTPMIDGSSAIPPSRLVRRDAALNHLGFPNLLAYRVDR